MEAATNWDRAFKKVNVELKYLISFAIINQVAAEEFLHHFNEKFFEIPEENLLYETPASELANERFVRREVLK